jgi:hypothetical protein
MITHWDKRVFLRSLGASALVFLLAWLVTAATDEGAIGWGERAGRALPLTPICAAIGTWMGLAAARARGETRALEALGRSPAQLGAPAVTGAAAFAIAAAATIASVSSVGVEGFFPSVPRAQAFFLQDDALVDAKGELRVRVDGVPERVESPRPPQVEPGVTIPEHGRLAAALATLFAGMALPLLVARLRPGAIARGVVGVGGAIAAALVLFQAAAGHRVHVAWAVAPPLLLLAAALRVYRGAS